MIQTWIGNKEKASTNAGRSYILISSILQFYLDLHLQITHVYRLPKKMEKCPNNKQQFVMGFSSSQPSNNKKTAAPEDVPWESLDQYLRRVVHPKNPQAPRKWTDVACIFCCSWHGDKWWYNYFQRNDTWYNDAIWSIILCNSEAYTTSTAYGNIHFRNEKIDLMHSWQSKPGWLLQAPTLKNLRGGD